MKKWEKLYLNKKFKIDSFAPSQLVKEILKCKNKFRNILDIGCGNGRNSIYLSKFAKNIDAIDKANLKFMNSLSKKIKEKIKFYKKDIEEFNLNKKEYDLIIMIRVIQYISPIKLRKVFKRISKALDEKGLIAISYTVSGGIFNQNLNIEKYSHSIKFLRGLFRENGLKIKMIRKGCKDTTHVPYKSKVEVYELILIKF